MGALALLHLLSAAAVAGVPSRWEQRAAAGSLVYSEDVSLGPLPNFGNGYVATQWAAPPRTQSSLYIAGVFQGDLPPPFGASRNAVSRRATVPLLIGCVVHDTTALSQAWSLAALANDYEQATVEELYARSGPANPVDASAVNSNLILRHYANRDSMHLLVTEAVLTIGARPVTATLKEETRSRAGVLLGTDASSSPSSSPPLSSATVGIPSLRKTAVGENPISFKAAPTSPPGAACYVGTTRQAEPGAENTTVAMCHTNGTVQLTVSSRSSFADAMRGADTMADATDSATLFTSIWTSHESSDPLAAAAAEWSAAVSKSSAAAALALAHQRAQDALWDSRIEVEGNLSVALYVNSSLYGILISLRDGLNYSTSPGGLPNGCYNGHVFWDVEQFMWPNLLLLHPPLARGAMQYRFDRRDAAARNSKMITNTSGLKYPWESGYTGLAATPYFAAQNEYMEIHIDGDVSLAMWQTFQASRDLQWLETVGWPIIKGAAQFWASRLSRGPAPGSGGTIALINAGGPDESNSHAEDNSYDLASALHSVEHALAAAKLLGKESEVGANWTSIVQELPSAFTYGRGNDGRAVMECWGPGAKGDDNKKKCNGIGVLMQRYPLNMSTAILNDTVQAANLDHYAAAWPGGNSMYWSMFTLGYSDVGNTSEADRFLAKSTDGFVSGPYRIWSEVKGGGGCPNFLTGAGIYLQSVWAGYIGVRYSDDSLQIRHPRMIPGTRGVRLRGVSYAGARLLIEVTAAGVKVSIMPAESERAYGLNRSNGNVKLVIAVDNAAAVPLSTMHPTTVPLGSNAKIFVAAATAAAVPVSVQETQQDRMEDGVS